MEPTSPFIQETSWEYSVTLEPGVNSFVFASRDSAGNRSNDVPVDILFEDIPPLPVAALTVNGAGNGTTAVLDWSGYDESRHGDIAEYRIYAESSDYTDVAGLTAAATLPSGTFGCTLSGIGDVLQNIKIILIF